jgi:hypothetical protein
VYNFYAHGEQFWATHYRAVFGGFTNLFHSDVVNKCDISLYAGNGHHSNRLTRGYRGEPLEIELNHVKIKCGS